MALPPLTVRLRDTLDLVLLLDGVRVRGPLGSVDELIGEALGDGLDVTEGSLAGAGGDQVDGLQRRSQSAARPTMPNCKKKVTLADSASTATPLPCGLGGTSQAAELTAGSGPHTTGAVPQTSSYPPARGHTAATLHLPSAGCHRALPPRTAAHTFRKCPIRTLPGPSREHSCAHLVHAAERRDIHSLATDHTGGANTGGILAGAGVDDGINADLDGVLVGEEVDDLERVLDDAHRHDLLAVVAAVLHHGVHEAPRPAPHRPAPGDGSHHSRTKPNAQGIPAPCPRPRRPSARSHGLIP
mmetsp:Transcript_1753/g.6310  ORF Transcript_1753/g.6310 Transcript_1753/m.6310 type:complete len:299 (-) Transcript_1753:325-1221(-)